MKIFVTGGAGFIGSYIVKSLLDLGNQVTIYDNLKNSTEEKSSYLIKKGASFIKGDIIDKNLLLKGISGHDLIIHLAAESDVLESSKNPQFTNLVNVTGTQNVLHACFKHKISKVIVTSSAAVYGEPKHLSLTEKSPTLPLSPYGKSKLAMENYIKVFSHTYNLNSIILRLFNVYGLCQSDLNAGVIKKFIDNIAYDKSLEIFGDGKNTRDFVSVEDVVNSIQLAMKELEGKKGAIYNIASGKYISIEDLANLLIDISGKKLLIEYKKQRIGEIKNSQTSIMLAEKELGYFPKIKLKDGLSQLLKQSSSNFH